MTPTQLDTTVWKHVKTERAEMGRDWVSNVWLLLPWLVSTDSVSIIFNIYLKDEIPSLWEKTARLNTKLIKNKFWPCMRAMKETDVLWLFLGKMIVVAFLMIF